MRIPVNPKLPLYFDDTPNDQRPASHDRWWFRPYVRTYTDVSNDPRWREWWPSGTRYDVRCLDGGAWDRSSFLGSYATLEEAIAHAKAIAENVERNTRALAKGARSRARAAP